MTTPQRDKELKIAIAAEMRDWALADQLPGSVDILAGMIAERIGPLLRQRGWLPPGTTERIQEWAAMTGKLPEHHVNPGVLNSHLCELADILYGR
jgi:hypothetical protein